MEELSKKADAIVPLAKRFSLNKPLSDGLIIRMKSLSIGETSASTFSSIEGPMFERNVFRRDGRAFAAFAGRMERYAELCGLDLALSNDVRLVTDEMTVMRMIMAVGTSYITSGNFSLARIIRDLNDMLDSRGSPVCCISFPEFGEGNHQISKMGGLFVFEADGTYGFVPLGRRGKVEVKGDDDAQPYFDFGGSSFVKFESDYPIDIPIGLRSYMAWKQIPLTFGGVCFVVNDETLRSELEDGESKDLAAVAKSAGISLSCPVPKEGLDGI